MAVVAKFLPALGFVICACAAPPPQQPPPIAVQLPADEAPEQPPPPEDDGYLDISEFLDSKLGFLPLVIPITEPAVGYGAAAGAAFFHTRPQRVETAKGPRVLPPNVTMAAGAATENGTWAGFAGHLHTWNNGRVRYFAGAMNGVANLDWFGQDDSFGGRSFTYNLQLWGLMQKLTLKIGDSDFFWGLQQRYLATHAEFEPAPGLPPPAGLDLDSADLDVSVSGLGLVGAYDTRDSMFSPTQGHKLSLTVTSNNEALGSDRNYANGQLEDCSYFPLGGPFVLGVRGDAKYSGDAAPFFDLASINLRGIQAGRYVDNASLTLETELRWDLARRWTLVGFGGVGAVADDFGDLGASDNHWAGGAGFRYLIASAYDMRLGLDVARGPEQYAMYVTVGTGWVRD